MQKIKVFLLIAGVVAIVGMVASYVLRQPSEDEVYLAKNLLFETARDSHLRARQGDRDATAELEAISRVVLARKRLGRKGGFASTVRGVVCQPRQFSWTIRHSTKNPAGCEREPTHRERYNFMLALAKKHLNGEFQTAWPEEHACILWYKRKDDRYVGKGPKRWFDKNLRSVVTHNHHTFFCKRDLRLQKAQAKP